MYFSKASLHPPVVVLPEHKAGIENALSPLIREARPQTRLAEQPSGYFELPLTTVSLNSNFDAYIDIFSKDAPATSAVQLLLDSGNSVLVVPRWEDIEALPNSNLDYQVLGDSPEPWGCPANVVRGPINCATTSGEVYSVEEDCVFYACTGDSPSGSVDTNTTFYPGNSTEQPTAYSTNPAIYVQIPKDHNACGITTTNAWVLRDLANGASGQAAAVGGLVANTPGGISIGLGVLGKISIGDNQTLSVMVKTAASRVALRATLASSYCWTLRHVKFDVPEP